jgi:hypothetical protein
VQTVYAMLGACKRKVLMCCLIRAFLSMLWSRYKVSRPADLSAGVDGVAPIPSILRHRKPALVVTRVPVTAGVNTNGS